VCVWGGGGRAQSERGTHGNTSTRFAHGTLHHPCSHQALLPVLVRTSAHAPARGVCAARCVARRTSQDGDACWATQHTGDTHTHTAVIPTHTSCAAGAAAATVRACTRAEGAGAGSALRVLCCAAGRGQHGEEKGAQMHACTHVKHALLLWRDREQAMHAHARTTEQRGGVGASARLPGACQHGAWRPTSACCTSCLLATATPCASCSAARPGCPPIQHRHTHTHDNGCMQPRRHTHANTPHHHTNTQTHTCESKRSSDGRLLMSSAIAPLGALLGALAAGCAGAVAAAVAAAAMGSAASSAAAVDARATRFGLLRRALLPRPRASAALLLILLTSRDRGEGARTCDARSDAGERLRLWSGRKQPHAGSLCARPRRHDHQWWSVCYNAPDARCRTPYAASEPATLRDRWQLEGR
jgi:hypothetical protein